MSLAEAIIAVWETSSLPSEVPGGFHWDEAPTNVVWPYQTVSLISEVRSSKTSSSIITRPTFEIQTFVRMKESEYPVYLRDRIQQLTETLFDDSVLTLTDKVAMIIVQTNKFSFKEDAEVFRGVNEFTFTQNKSR